MPDAPKRARARFGALIILVGWGGYVMADTLAEPGSTLHAARWVFVLWIAVGVAMTVRGLLAEPS